MRIRRVLPVTLATVMAGVTLLAAPAHAVGVDALCAVGTFSTTFTPAMTSTSNDVTATTESSYGCTIGASSGSSTFALDLDDVSCVELLFAMTPFTEVVAWTGGSGAASSTIRYTSATSNETATTYIGTVQSGRFAGDSAVRVTNVLSVNGTNPLLCPIGLGNVTGVNGLAALTITSLS